MSEIHSLLTRGVELYEQLVGVTRDKTTGTFTMGEWEARRTLEDLDESLALDPTGVTSVLLLRHFTETSVASRSFNWLELLRNPELASQLDLPRSILTVVESPLISDAEVEFRDQLTRALRHYDAVDRKDVQELLNDAAELAFLRRDALRSISRLRVDQFLDGAGEYEGTKPTYAKIVHQWWNVNSLLDQMTRLPSGVSLNLIREPDGYSSFFAFAIRNGARLFTLSDIEPEAHPLQNQMSRRPDRTLERRIARNWFPYDLLGLDYNEEDGRIYLEKASSARGLAVRQSKTLPLQGISDMDPHSLVWTVMMFELILEKFWRQEHRELEMSYTGEMIQHEASLLTAATTAGLPAVVHQPLGLTPLTVAIVKETSSDEMKEALGNMPENHTHWMMERYGDQATEESVNLLGGPTQVFLLESSGGITTRSSTEIENMGHFAKKDLMQSSSRLQQLSATAFGTKERLDQDRIWLGRYNLVTQVQKAADREYELRKDEVLTWYRERVKANVPTLLAAMGHGKLDRRSPGGYGFGERISSKNFGIRHISSPGFDHGTRGKDKDGYTLVTLMTTVTKEEHKAAPYGRGDVWSRGWSPCGQDAQNFSPICAFTGAKAVQQVTAFAPLDAQDIAWLAGCSVADLPDVLQHYEGRDPYTGNSILSRIDPAATRLKNPWLDLNLVIRLGVSKRGIEKMLSVRTDDVLSRWQLSPT